MSFDELADQGGDGCKAHLMPTLAGGQAESQCDVRFARAAVAQQQHVLVTGEELRSCQFQYQGLFTEGMARKSKQSMVLTTGNFA